MRRQMGVGVLSRGLVRQESGGSSATVDDGWIEEV